MPERRRLVGTYAVVAAVGSLLLSPLLALAYFETAEGAGELEVSTVSAWAEPARDAVGGLLAFASADRVYSTYLQALALLAPALLLCAGVTRRLRPDAARGAERWGWRLALLGYALLTLGLLLVAAVLLVATPQSPAANAGFLALVVPGLVLGTIGSTVLGIALLRADFRPRASAWLLALAVPLWLVGSIVLGHNSLGLVPLFLAWGLAGLRLLRADDQGAAAVAGSG